MRAVPIGLVPQAIAVDQRTHRALVVVNGSLEGGSGRVDVFNTRNGALLRTVPVGIGPWAIAVDEQVAHAFVIDPGLNAAGHTVSMLDTGSGRTLRTISVPKDPIALAISERTARVFVAHQVNDTISVLDALSGTLLRTTRVGKSPMGIAIDEQTSRVFVSNQASHSVSMLDAATGAVVTTVLMSGGWPSSPLVDSPVGRVFVATQAIDTRGNPIGPSTLHVLDARSGAERTTFILSRNAGPVAVDERTGRVIIVQTPPTQPNGRGSLNGSVSLLDPRTGRIVHSTNIGTDIGTVVIDELRQHILVTSRDALSVLDARSGTILRTITTGGGTGNVALDQKTGIAFVSGEKVPNQDVFGWLRIRARQLFLPDNAHTVDQQALPTGIVDVVDTATHG